MTLRIEDMQQTKDCSRSKVGVRGGRGGVG